MTAQIRTPSRMDKLDFVSSIFLTLLGLGVLIESLRMPRLENLTVNPYTVPGIVPGFLGILLTICGLFILIRSALRGGWKLGLTGENGIAWTKSGAVKRSIVTLTLTLIYAVILFPIIPFYFATPLFIFAFVLSAEAMSIGAWPKWRTVITGLILSVFAGFVIGFVFQELFYIRLPGG